MHGGDVYRNKVKIDFSISVNPLGISDAVKNAFVSSVESLGRYPDIKCERLRSAIACMIGCAHEQIVCGNGASELILAFFRMANPLRVLLPVPCFTGYEHAIESLVSVGANENAESSRIECFELLEENDFCLNARNLPLFLDRIKSSKPGACVITNPNNPCGKLAERSVIEEIACACEMSGTKLLLDECFIELTGRSDAYSFAPLLEKYPSVTVLRAFTKTMAIPGLRLGYCVTSGVSASGAILKQLPEWNVSEPAQKAGVAAAGEKDYLDDAVKFICRERFYLSEELRKLGFYVFPSDANFILFRTGVKMSCDIYGALLEEGILIRDCGDMKGLCKGYYRIAVRTHAENEVLVASLKKLCQQNEV